MFDTDIYKAKMTESIDHFKSELKKVRTGRAHPSMLEGVFVEVYGSKMPLNQVSNMTAPEAGMILITPFDPANISAISAAIRNDQSLGFNPSDDGRVVRGDHAAPAQIQMVRCVHADAPHRATLDSAHSPDEPSPGVRRPHRSRGGESLSSGDVPY